MGKAANRRGGHSGEYRAPLSGGPSRGRSGGRSGGHAPKPRGYWLYGLHAGAAAWLNPKRGIHRAVATEAGAAALRTETEKASGGATGLGRPVIETVEPADFNRQFGDQPGHSGIALDIAPLTQPDLPAFVERLAADRPACLVFLDQVTDPHNIGAILRSAAAFGADAVVAQDRNAPEETPSLAKAASGGLERVPYIKVTNISRSLLWLAGHDFSAIGFDETGDPDLAAILGKAMDRASARIALVMGAEGSGMRRLVSERCQFVAALPTVPPVQSLNVSNAAAIALYAWRNRVLSGLEGAVAARE